MFSKQKQISAQWIMPFAVIIFILCTVSAYSEEKVLALIKEKGQQQQDTLATLEDLGAVILETDEEIVLNENGSFEYTKYEKIKVTSERGKKFGEIQIHFNKNFDKIKSIEAYTIRSDGERIKATKTQDFVPSHPSDTYSGDFARVIYMPMVEIGSVIEYTVKKDVSYPIYEKTFDYNYFFGGITETKKSRFVLTIPENKKLLYKTYNTSITPVITYSDTGKGNGKKRQITYEWEADDIIKMVPEEGMPPVEEIVPWLTVSTIENWDAVKDLWWGKASQAFQISPSIRNKAKELTAGLKTDREKADAIVEYVAQNIKYLGLEFNELIFVPDNATNVFKNKYGDCKGKSVLLMTMLHEVGIESYPVLIRNRAVGKIDTSIPTISLFNHVIVYCKIDNEEYWLDPTLKFASFGYLAPQYQNIDALVLFKEASKFILTPRSSQNDETESISAKVNVGKDGKSQGTISMTLNKYADVIFKNALEELDSKQTDELVYNLFGEIAGGGNMIGYEIKNKNSRSENIKLDFNFESNSWATARDDYLIVRPTLLMVDTAFFNKPQRKQAIFSLYPMRKTADINITIPDAYELKSLPADLDIESAAGKVSMHCSSSSGALSWTKTVINDRMYISPSDYHEVKNLIGKVTEAENQQAIFIKR